MKSMVFVASDCGDLSAHYCEFRVERGEFQMLPALAWAIVAARKGKNQRIVILKLDELAHFALVIGQFEVGESASGTISGGTIRFFLFLSEI